MSRIRKIIQITDLKNIKNGLIAAHKLGTKFNTVEDAMNIYKGIVWPLYEFYKFLGIYPDKIINYHINGLTVEQIKANLDWMIDHPNEELFSTTEKKVITYNKTFKPTYETPLTNLLIK